MTAKVTVYETLVQAANNANKRLWDTSEGLAFDFKYLSERSMLWLGVPAGRATFNHSGERQPEVEFLMSKEPVCYHLPSMNAQIKSEVVLPLKIGKDQLATYCFELSLTNVKGVRSSEAAQTITLQDRTGTVVKSWTLKTGGLDCTEKAKAYAKVYRILKWVSFW